MTMLSPAQIQLAAATLLQDTISRVATAYKCSHDAVEVAFDYCDGEWGWTVRVRAQYKLHGRGRRLVQPESHSWAESLEKAELISTEKAWSYLELNRG